MGKLNEAFSSRKLADMAKQHGGIGISINGGMRNGANAFHGGSSVDVSKITDDMLIGEPFKYDYKNTPDKVAANLIHFKDGYAVSLKPYDLKSGNNINPERPRQKPSRYGTGIGDTGDHNKKESPFFKNGKKDVGPEYNGFGISSRAGESQHYREAIKNNKNDIKYYEEHPDGEYSKNAINKAKKNIQTIKGYGKELLNKRKNENKNMKQAIKLNESQLKKIVLESVKRILNENMSQRYRIDLKTNSRENQQSSSQLHSLLNSHKPMKCVLDMFYGNGFTCEVTFSTNGDSICTMNVISSTQYDKTFVYNTGNAVQQALNIGRNLCNQWLQSAQQNRQQTIQQQS